MSSTKTLGPSVQAFSHEYEAAKRYYSRKMRRCQRNWRLYLAQDPELGLGQWPEEVVAYMLEQRRQLIQYNFVQPIVDTIAGGIMQTIPDPEFYPTNREVDSLTEAIKFAMYSDKEILDWNAAILDLVRAGLIHEGVLKMYISREYDDLGNIGLHYCLPGTVFADPYWKAQESKHCQKAWWETWHTAEQLADTYPDKAHLFAGLIGLARNFGDDYGPAEGPTPYMGGNSQWGSQYKLVREYRMVVEQKSYEVAITDEGTVRIPDYDTPEEKIQWLNLNHPTWDPTRVFEESESVKVCKVRAMCPQLSPDELLVDDYCDIQIGRLPFFWWSANRVNGEASSIVDSAKDAQESINYLSSLNMYKLQIEGGGGSQFVDRTLFRDDKTYMDYVQNRNNPAKAFEVAPGTLRDGRTPAAPTIKSSFPAESYRALQHIIEVVLPNTTRATPASKGMTEGPVESGRLFEMLKIQSDQQVYTINYGIRRLFNEIYEAYLMLASDVYANESVERKMVYDHGRKSVILNERVQLPDGRKAIKNDVQRLKGIRHKVIVSETQQSPTERIQRLNSYGKFIKELGQSSPLVTRFVIGKAAEIMEGLDEEDRDAVKVLSDVDLQVALQDAKVKLAQLKRAELQEQQALAKLEAGGQPGAEGQPGQQPPPQGSPPPSPEQQAPAPELVAQMQAQQGQGQQFSQPNMAPVGQGGMA